MAHQKKHRRWRPEKLTRKPQNELDARVLALKQRSREQATQSLGTAFFEDGPYVGEPSNSNQHGAPDITKLFDFLPVGPASDVGEHALKITNHYNEGFDRGRRHREEEAWQKKLPAMFPVFLECKHKTKTWSSFDTSLKDWKVPCTCADPLRTLDVLDIFG